MSNAKKLSDFGTSVLSDALDRLGIPGQAEGIRPVGRSDTLCGPAFTVAMGPVGEIPGSVGDYLDDVEAGAVVVIDNAGRTDTTVWGGLLSFTASRWDVAGTVIHGVCRDSAVLDEVDYAVFARATHMRTGKDRVQAESFQTTVSLGAARVAPEDWVVGDRDGVVVVPADAVERVLLIAAEIEAAEDAIRGAVAAGSRLDEARRKFGYHALQSRFE